LIYSIVRHCLPVLHLIWGRWNRETWQRGTRLYRSQRVKHPLGQGKIEHCER